MVMLRVEELESRYLLSLGGDALGTLVTQLQSGSHDAVQFFENLNAWIYLSLLPGSRLERPRPRTPESVLASMWGDCEDRYDLMLGVAEHLGYEARPVNLYNVPYQGNHTATEIDIGGKWCFFDSTTGIYFTSPGGSTPLSFATATAWSPSVDIRQAQGAFWTGSWHYARHFAYAPLQQNILVYHGIACFDVDATYFPGRTSLSMSNQSVSAVNTFLQYEKSFEISQVAGINLEADIIEHKSNTLSPADIDYMLTIDADLVQIDNDLVGTPGITGSTATSGINGTLMDLALPVNTAGKLKTQMMPAVHVAREATTTVIGQLQQLQTLGKPVLHASAGDVVLKVEGIARKAADAAMLDFAKIEYEFIGADATDLGTAFGAQGSAPAGATGGLLQDLAVLTADAAGPNTTSSSAAVPARNSSAPSAISQFLTLERAYVTALDVYLHRKLPGTMKSGQITLSQGAVAYFLKLDADLLQINGDLIGAPGAGDGIDGALLDLHLPKATLNSIEARVTAVGHADTAILAREKLLADAHISSSGSSLAGFEAAARQQANPLALDFANIEISFINQTTGLGSALGVQGSAAPGPAGSLLQDALVWATDAGGTFPGAIVYPPPAVVDAFLNIENAVVANQNTLVSAQQAYIKLDVQLPAPTVAYFAKIDSDLLEIDNSLLGTAAGPGGAGVAGIDSVLANLGDMPTAYVSQIQGLDNQLQSRQQAVTAAQAAVGNTSGAVLAATLAELHKLRQIQAQAESAFVTIAANFNAIVDELIALDPGDNALIQDCNTIADGAAKGQAQA